MRETKVFGSAIKTVTLDQFFDRVKTLEGAGIPQEMYRAVAWVFRCVQIRANAVARIPYQVLRGETKQEFLPLGKLLWDTEAALCLWGAGFWLKKVQVGKVLALQWLNPSSIEIKKSSKGIEGFEQTVGSEKKVYKPDQVVYFRSFNPGDDLGPGISPGQVSLEAAGLARNANRWASAFFEHGAVPAVILESEGRIDVAEQKRIEGVWQQFVGGVKNAFRTIALGKGMTANVIGSPVKDVAMPELMEQVRQQIAVSFGIPQTLLEDAANFATAKEHHKSLYTETIMPEAEIIIQQALNEQLFSKLNPPLEFAFDFNALEIMQEEERDRAESVLQLVQAGCPLATALAILGIDVPEGLSIEPTLRPVLPGEQVLPMGKFLREPGVDWSADLRLWEKKAVRHVKEHGFGVCSFTSETIPPWIRLAVLQKLGEASTEEEVREVFAGAMGTEAEVAEWHAFLTGLADWETRRLWPGYSYVSGSSPALVTDGQGRFFEVVKDAGRN